MGSARPEKSGAFSWRDIHGWFTDEDAELYRQIVQAIPENGIFVEVGCWLGRSLAALHAFAHEANKTIRIHAVDTFQGVAICTHIPPHIRIQINNAGARILFKENMRACGVSGFMLHTKDSVRAAQDFRDESLNAVFIDAGHSQAEVAADIWAWMPKVKPGGILAGHDYPESGVRAAVNTIVGEVTVVGRCWKVTL